ncbi:MAG: hypothetical protein PVJ10_07995, partial [Thiohalophilus sp.]
YVPGNTEKAKPIEKQFDGNFHDKYAQDDLVGSYQQNPEVFHQHIGGFHAEDNRIEYDKQDYSSLYTGRFYPMTGFRPKRIGIKIAEYNVRHG